MPPKRKTVKSDKATTEADTEQPQEEVPVKMQRKAKEPKQGKAKTEADIEQPQEEVPVKKQRKAKEPKQEEDQESNKSDQSSSRRTNRKGAKDKPIEAEVENGGDIEPKKSKKTAKKAEPTSKEKTKKQDNKKTESKTSSETNWEKIDFSCNKKNAKGKSHNFKITSWNVSGLKAWLKKDGLSILKFENPDILCLQETKCSEAKLPEEITAIEGYHHYWCSSKKEGYAGVGVFSKTKPVSVTYGIGDEKHDEDGRCITLEYKSFYLVNVYVTNAGRGLVTLPKRLEWNETFKAHVMKLDKKKPVIVCGDMNVAHSEIDLANPKSNKKSAGFTQEERDGMTDFLEHGYVDTYRELYPEESGVYTFWAYFSNARAKNVGWRLDYFIVSNRLMEDICENAVRSEVYGSDHCPITLFLNI